MICFRSRKCIVNSCISEICVIQGQKTYHASPSTVLAMTPRAWVLTWTNSREICRVYHTRTGRRPCCCCKASPRLGSSHCLLVLLLRALNLMLFQGDTHFPAAYRFRNNDKTEIASSTPHFWVHFISAAGYFRNACRRPDFPTSFVCTGSNCQLAARRPRMFRPSRQNTNRLKANNNFIPRSRSPKPLDPRR